MNTFLKDDMDFSKEQSNDLTAENAAGLHPQIKASLFPNFSAGNRAVDSFPRETETWDELVDSLIYPRMKFRERYMETPEAPYR